MLRKFITQIPFNIKLSFISFFSFILIFNIWRLVFLYFYIDDFNASPFLYLQSFYFGYTLDAILASILTLPITIISFIPKIKFKGYIQFSYYCYLLLLVTYISRRIYLYRLALLVRIMDEFAPPSATLIACGL